MIRSMETCSKNICVEDRMYGEYLEVLECQYSPGGGGCEADRQLRLSSRVV